MPRYSNEKVGRLMTILPSKLLCWQMLSANLNSEDCKLEAQINLRYQQKLLTSLTNPLATRTTFTKSTGSVER